MKSHEILLVLAAALSIPAYAQNQAAQTPNETASPATTAAYPHAQTENGFTFMCGGIGQNEAADMKQAASKYDLMMTFAASNNAYLANVNVEIVDSRGKPLLKTNCDAPIMLVDFPKSGTYRIRSETNGHALTRTARVQSGGKARRLAMVWPVKMVDMGRDPNLPLEESSGNSNGDTKSGEDGERKNGDQ